MVKLKLAEIEDDKPVRLAVTLTGRIHRDLLAYAALIGGDSGERSPEPAQLVPLMIARFMATDRVFRKLTREVKR